MAIHILNLNIKIFSQTFPNVKLIKSIQNTNDVIFTYRKSFSLKKTIIDTPTRKTGVRIRISSPVNIIEYDLKDTNPLNISIAFEG